MTALKSKPATWLLPLAALGAVAAILVALVALRDDAPRASTVELPSSLRVGRSSSTDNLVGELQKRLKADPKDFAANINLANAYLQQVRETGDPSLYTKAEELLDRAGEADAEHPELYASRATLALARHEFGQALELGEKALAKGGDARYYGIVGDAQIELGRYEEAVRSYQEMVNRRPDFASYSRVAHARELYGKPEGAMRAMRSAIEAGSTMRENAAWAYVQLGNLHFTLGEADAALQQYELSLKRLENYPLALAGKAQATAARGDLKQAAALYQEAFNRNPLSEYAILLGDVYSKMGDKQKATEQYELVRAIDELQRANGVNTDMETALFYADHDIEIEESLDKARAAHEARPSIHVADALAWTLYKAGEMEEADRYSREALRLGTRDPLKLFHAGMIAKALGDEGRARQHLEAALELNPRFSILYSDQAAAALEELGGKSAGGGGR